MGTFELREDAGGLRHFLDGRPVHAGAELELLLADGTRIRGRYEWGFERRRRPTFKVDVAPASEELEVSFPLPPKAKLRWPELDAP